MPNDETVNVRYMVDDVDESIAFYTEHLGFEVLDAARRPRSPTSSEATCACCSPDPRAPRAGRCPTAPNRDRGAGTASTSSSTTSTPKSPGCATRARRSATTSWKGPAASRSSSKTRPATSSSCSSRPAADPNRASNLTGTRSNDVPSRPSLVTVARQWGRIGCIGFGGPPAHIALLRELCVDASTDGSSASEFEDGIAACNLLPGPASTQLAIFCAWRVAGAGGAFVGGVAFIVPGLVAILGLAARVPRRRHRRPGCSGQPRGPERPWSRGRRQRRGRADPCELAAVLGAALAMDRLCRGRRRGRRVASAPGWWLVLLGCGFVEMGCRRFGRDHHLGLHLTPFALAAAGPAARRSPRARLGGGQGRRTVVRRRVRDHPHDAERRRATTTTG